MCREGRIRGMTGPFADEDTVGATEYGGDAGLVQDVDHEPTPSERIAMAVRTSPDDALAVDPATGLSAL